MEKLIVEEVYQKIKREMNKKGDYFTPEEVKQFTNIYRNFNAIFNATPRIFVNNHK